MFLNSQATDDDLKSQLDLIIQFVEEIEPERNPHEEDVLQTSHISDAQKVIEPKLSEAETSSVNSLVRNVNSLPI